jgi:hypothetical protein
MARISLSFHRAGTGLYAGLKLPTVCAHSPVGGWRVTSSLEGLASSEDGFVEESSSFCVAQ